MPTLDILVLFLAVAGVGQAAWTKNVSAAVWAASSVVASVHIIILRGA